jgi:hypothetical protein
MGVRTGGDVAREAPLQQLLLSLNQAEASTPGGSIPVRASDPANVEDVVEPSKVRVRPVGVLGTVPVDE